MHAPDAEFIPRAEQAWQSTAAIPPATAVGIKQATVAYSTIPRPLWLLRTPQSLRAENDVPRLQGPLQLVAGPERIESGWWDGQNARRDYYVARNRQGETFWIYREHRREHWYLHGVFA